MTDIHLTGGAAIIAAIALLIHALRAAIPVVSKALADRAASQRIDAETRSKIEQGREDTAHDLRGQRDACARELAKVRAQLEALRAEVDELRRAVASGGVHT